MSTGSMEQLYQQVILDHAKFPHGKGLGAAGDLHLHTGESHQVNPTCGDEVTLQVDLDDDRRVVRDVRWDGQGCSISQASVSVLHDLVVGNDLATVDADRRHVPRAHADARRGPRRRRRGDPRRRDRLHGRRQVPRADQVRPARLGGADRRTHQDRRTGETHEHGHTPHPTTVADVEEALRDVIDPELGINVVDLGLIYGVVIDQTNTAIIDMTLTSAACPLTDVIEDQSASALDGIVDGFRINWVWMPPWGPEKITPDGREQMRALGFNI